MERNSHLEWRVPYSPGTLLAQGFKGGKPTLTKTVETTGEVASISLQADRGEVQADGEDAAVITVAIHDAQGRLVPTAKNEIKFTLEGPGRIIGVGNGDPSCHEPDRYTDHVGIAKIQDLRFTAVPDLKDRKEVAKAFDDSSWKPAFKEVEDHEGRIKNEDISMVIRGDFELADLEGETEVTLYAKSIGEVQSIYVNGKLIAKDVERDAPGQAYKLDNAILHPGKNIYAMVGRPLVKKQPWENLNTDPGVVGIHHPADPWKRSAFNGLAQVMVQAQEKAGKIVLKAEAEGLAKGSVEVQLKAAEIRAALP
jgi:beta-galactosidase